MNKLQDSILEKVSDRNNDYRIELSNFKDSLEQLSTKIAGDTVTLSNYSIDFSSVMDNIKEKLIDSIYQVVESYVIKDLRNVESVNTQFVDKINDRIDSAVINNIDDENVFITNLNNLLNEKYLEIVRIKRTEFFDYENGNLSVEECINDFISYLNGVYNFPQDKMEKLINGYKTDLYNNIKNMFNNINKLYLSVFVDEVINALKEEKAHDEEFNHVNNNLENTVNEVNEIDNVLDEPINNNVAMPEIPSISFGMPELNDSPSEPINNNLTMPEVPSISFGMPELADGNVDGVSKEPELPNISENKDVVAPMETPEVKPVEVSPTVKENKKTYDVEEILKIAKSPVVTMPDKTNNNSTHKSEFISVTPLKRVEETEVLESEFDEKEIVEEMIRRLTKRLDDIKTRQERYAIDEKKVLDDEAFVNELIENSNNKKLELDQMEKELDEKEQELNERQTSLDKKINDIMPFADAVLKNE